MIARFCCSQAKLKKNVFCRFVKFRPCYIFSVCASVTDLKKMIFFILIEDTVHKFMQFMFENLDEL